MINNFMLIDYRELSETDCESLTSLWSQSKLPFKPSGRDRLDRLKKQMQLPLTTFLGAWDKTRLIGSVIASHNGRKGWITRLAVHPDYRGKGIASNLIKQCEDTFEAFGIKIFTCLIEDWNSESSSLFMKNDYNPHPDIRYFTKRKEANY